uniref:Uncharacterized protein n=1 Tax=Arundo donax TaxID=35708 RepID=A0A0A9BUR5_ARUDO
MLNSALVIIARFLTSYVSDPVIKCTCGEESFFL